MKRKHLGGFLPPAAILLVLTLAALDTFLPGLARADVLRWVSLAALALAVVTMIHDRREAALWPVYRSFLVASGLLLLLIAVYALNPTHRAVSGVGLLPVSHVGFLPGTVHAEETRATLWFMVSCVSVAGCALLLPVRAAKVLLPTLLAAGALVAFMVLSQRLSPRTFPVYERTGIFVSENHFAAFANLVYPLALASASRIQFCAFSRGRVSSPAPLVYALALVIALAVWYSRSRAGLAVTILITLAFIAHHVALRRRYPFIAPPMGKVIRLAGVVLLVALGSSTLAYLAREWNSAEQFGREVSYRGRIIADAWTMWIDRPAWGVGPGAFASAFPYYQDASIQDRFVRHAHHEPVELLAEYGIAGTVLLLAALWWLIRSARMTPAGVEDAPGFRELESVAVMLGFAGCLLHGLVDFPLHTPLVGLMMSVYAGVMAAYWPRWQAARMNGRGTDG